MEQHTLHIIAVLTVVLVALVVAYMAKEELSKPCDVNTFKMTCKGCTIGMCITLGAILVSSALVLIIEGVML